MRFEGKLVAPAGKKNRYWAVEIPLLFIHTQGKDQKEALLMAKDAIESLVDKKGFKVKVHLSTDDTFTIDSSDRTLFLAFLLKRQREFHSLTVRQVAERMHSKSPNAYAQYEQGKVTPSMDKLVQLLQAINPAFQPVLKAA